MAAVIAWVEKFPVQVVDRSPWSSGPDENVPAEAMMSIAIINARKKVGIRNIVTMII